MCINIVGMRVGDDHQEFFGVPVVDKIETQSF